MFQLLMNINKLLSFPKSFILVLPFAMSECRRLGSDCEMYRLSSGEKDHSQPLCNPELA